MTNTAIWSMMILALWPLVCTGEEETTLKPSWEIHARLGGAAPAVFTEFLTSTLGGGLAIGAAEANATLRIAGFENEDTEEGDWIAEIQGVPGVEKLLGDLAVRTHGKVLANNDGIECALWSAAAGSLLVASPSANADKQPSVAAPLKEGSWLGGWIDVRKIDDEGIKSRTLKLVDEMAFTVTGSGDAITAEVRATFKNEQVAGQAQALLANLETLLQEISPVQPVAAPRMDFEVQGTILVLRFHFTEAEARQFLENIGKELGATKGKEKPEPPSGP